MFDGFGEMGWTLEAWAVLSNHYHVVAHSPRGSGETLGPRLKKLHSLATKRINREDGAPGRTRLWQNFRETHLTFQHSYLARLNYVHQNPKHHGVVPVASQWKWCSAAAFKRAVTPARRTANDGAMPVNGWLRQQPLDCGSLLPLSRASPAGRGWLFRLDVLAPDRHGGGIVGESGRQPRIVPALAEDAIPAGSGSVFRGICSLPAPAHRPESS